MALSVIVAVMFIPTGAFAEDNAAGDAANDMAAVSESNNQTETENTNGSGDKSQDASGTEKNTGSGIDAGKKAVSSVRSASGKKTALGEKYTPKFRIEFGKSGYKYGTSYTYHTSDDGTLENCGDDGETKVMEYLKFKITHVFDISQTEGKELPSLGIDELSGGVDEYHNMYKALLHICPVPIVQEDIKGGAKGYYSDAEQRIAILTGMSEMQTIKTMIHEIAHQKMHSSGTRTLDMPIDRRTKEVEAESVAYTVCQKLGLDTSDYSFGYIAGWSSGRDVKELKASLERIRSAADELITAIDTQLDHFRKREIKRAKGMER